MLDVHRGRMSWRRLRVLIEHLPPESGTWTAIRNATPAADLAAASSDARPEEGRWSQVEMLLASLTDAVRILDYHLVLANSDPSKGGKVEPPEPIRRPGWKPSKPQPNPPSERALAVLDAMLAASA